MFATTTDGGDSVETLDQPNVASLLGVPVNNATASANPTLVIAHSYKTTLAKSLCDVLQDTPELQEFDKLRYHLKNTGSMARNRIQRYTKLSTLFENSVFQQYKKNSQKHTHNVCKKLLIHEWKHQL